MKLRLGSRKSKLAVAQAEWVAKRLQSHHAALQIEFVHIVTSGDTQAEVSLQKIGGKGVFVKEIEEALLKKQIDVAVHSLKDLPQTLPSGLVLGPCPEREDPRDAVISKFGELLQELPRGAIIGTSSPRRQAQIKNRFKKKYQLQDVRGNVDTRLKKLQEGQFDTIVMAAAGLKRLGLASEITQILEPSEMLPAPCQGCLGLELREDDAQTMKWLAPLRHEASDLAARAERAFLQGLGGDCLVPLGGLARLNGDSIEMEAILLNAEGDKAVRAKETGPSSQPEYVGACLAERLLHEGAAEILNPNIEIRNKSE